MKNTLLSFVVVVALTTDLFLSMFLNKIWLAFRHFYYSCYDKVHKIIISMFVIGGRITLKKLLMFVIAFLVLQPMVEIYGYLESLPIVIFVSLLVNYLLVKVYDHFKIDFFRLKKLKEKQNPFNQIDKKKKFKRLMFLFVLASGDTFLAVIYMREGDYNGLPNRRIVLFFIISAIMAELAFVGVYRIVDLFFSHFFPDFHLANLWPF